GGPPAYAADRADRVSPQQRRICPCRVGRLDGMAGRRPRRRGGSSALFEARIKLAAILAPFARHGNPRDPAFRSGERNQSRGQATRSVGIERGGSSLLSSSEWK